MNRIETALAQLNRHGYTAEAKGNSHVCIQDPVITLQTPENPRSVSYKPVTVHVARVWKFLDDRA